MRLRIENLVKRYGADRLGLQDVTVELEPGVAGLVGPFGGGFGGEGCTPP